MIDIIKYLKDRAHNKVPKGSKRSSRWRKIRKIHLSNFPNCAVCSSKKKIEVHHIIPFYIDPSFELDLSNLITLCENKKYGINCHLFIGHSGNYRKWNIDITDDIAYARKKLAK